MTDFFIKLFKAFNSAQTPWQMTLAITLGMVMGITPFEGIQTPILIFIALILNIHIGLFFVSATLFAGIAYLFDPLFESLGYYLLHVEGLESFWTSLYNDALARLSHFNNTIVLGSSVVGFFLALPLFLMLNTLVYVYRDKLKIVLEKYPILGKFGILSVEKKADKIIRIWGVGLLVILIALVTAFVFLFMDKLSKSALESSLSLLTQREVTLSKVEVSLKEASIRIQDLVVASKDLKKESVSIEDISFDINMQGLLFQKTHIDELHVKNLRFDETRDAKTFEKALFDKKAKNSKASNEEEVYKLPSFVLEAPQTLLQNANLKTPKLYESSKKEIERITKKWEKISKEEFTQKDLDTFSKELKSMQKKANSKDIATLLELIKDAQAFEKRVSAKTKRIAELNREFKKDSKYLTTLYAKLKKASSDDYAMLKKSYTLDENGAMNTMGLLFGEKIEGYIRSAKEYYDIVAPYIKSDDENETKEIKIARGEGRWIKFREFEPTPDVWIKKSEVSGVYSTQSYDVSVNNINSNPDILVKTTTMVLKSDGEKIQNLLIKGEDNRIGKNNYQLFDITASNLPTKKLDLQLLSLERSNIALKSRVKLLHVEKLTSNATLRFTKSDIQLKDQSGKINSMLQEVLSDVQSFDVDVDIEGSMKTPKVTASSDLDKKISASLSKVLRKQAKVYEKELKVIIDKELKKSLGSLYSEVGDVKKLGSLLDAETLSFKNYDKSVDILSKELEKRYKKEQKKLEDRAKKETKKEADKLIDKNFKKEDADKLKNLLKF